ncbi:MAG: hypothetical protein GY835_07050 [bacterium]|nr:hypothetical protein [bacterium]
MNSRKVIVLMAAMVLAMSSFANAGIIDPLYSFATLANPGVMLIAPGGAESFVFPEDHLIDVYLNDSNDNPVEVVATDIWIEDPVIVWCAGGTRADSSTYAPDPGHTTFSLTPRGGVDGDCSTISMNVIAAGHEIADLPLGAVSIDLNGSGDCNLVDFALFGGVFNVETDVLACANFNKASGGTFSVDLIDFAIFGGYFNQSNCP